MGHRRFNNGNKNLSRKGTKHCTAIDIWESANEIYYNGTHSDYQALSLYHRPSDRNNQALEGGHNGTISLGSSDIADSARGAFLRWINTAKREELEFENRQYQLNFLNAPPKEKDGILVDKDNAITSWVNKHKQNQITTRELLHMYMKLTNENELPQNLRHFSSDF